MICLCLFSGWATSQASTLVCQIAIFVAGFSPDYVANYSLIVSLSCQNKTNGVSCLQVASRIDIYLSINLSTQLNFTYVYIYVYTIIYHYLSCSVVIYHDLSLFICTHHNVWFVFIITYLIIYHDVSLSIYP